MCELRSATEDDRENLADMYMNDREDNYIHALLYANDLVNNHRTILCFNENRLAGLVCWRVCGLLEDELCEISHLYVRPNFRRMGIGSQLIDALISDVQAYFEERGFQFRLVYSFIKNSNTLANSFFKSINFNKASEIKSFYPNDDAVVWIKWIGKEN